MQPLRPATGQRGIVLVLRRDLRDVRLELRADQLDGLGDRADREPGEEGLLRRREVVAVPGRVQLRCDRRCGDNRERRHPVRVPPRARDCIRPANRHPEYGEPVDAEQVGHGDCVVRNRSMT